MKQGANVVPFSFKTRYSQLNIRLSERNSFEEDPYKWVWRDYGDKEEDKAWLDAQAPGWSAEFNTVGLVELELPIGKDPTGTFVTVNVDLCFALRDHLKAWQNRITRIQEDRNNIRKRIKARRAESNEPELICNCCGGDTEPFTKTETTRIAQFALTYEYTGRECKECHGWSVNIGSLDLSVDEIAKLVGLPDFDSPLWNHEIETEWKRRKNADPEIELVITKDMSAETILSILKEHLKEKGIATKAKAILKVEK